MSELTLDIAPLAMPTDEERKETSQWLKPLRPCLYTHWPERFKSLSFKTWVENVTPEEKKEFVRYFDDSPPPEWSGALKEKLTRGVSQFSGGAFFRLESRSAKDNYWGEMTRYRACSWHDIREGFYSERMLDDIARYEHLDEEPLRLLFREWRPIPKASEFRCFIYARRLVGISQYHYSTYDEEREISRPMAFLSIAGGQHDAKAAITQFINNQIIPHLHIDDIVVDLYIDPREGAITLIEVNPFGLSDPCLFSYGELLQAKECVFRFNAPDFKGLEV